MAARPAEPLLRVLAGDARAFKWLQIVLDTWPAALEVRPAGEGSIGLWTRGQISSSARMLADVAQQAVDDCLANAFHDLVLAPKKIDAGVLIGDGPHKFHARFSMVSAFWDAYREAWHAAHAMYEMPLPLSCAQIKPVEPLVELFIEQLVRERETLRAAYEVDMATLAADHARRVPDSGDTDDAARAALATLQRAAQYAALLVATDARPPKRPADDAPDGAPDAKRACA